MFMDYIFLFKQSVIARTPHFGCTPLQSKPKLLLLWVSELRHHLASLTTITLLYLGTHRLQLV